MAPWKLPLIVVALVVPIVAAFLTAGPALGVAIGALAVLAILVVAARQRPQGPIVSAPAEDRRHHVLVVAACAVEDPETVARIAEAASRNGEEAAVLVLAPVRASFLDRWASDVEPARQAAQRHLVATVAALAKAGVAAEARVGDEDLVQAVEDQLRSFPAEEVIVVSAGRKESEAIGVATAELESRLRAEFRHIVVGR